MVRNIPCRYKKSDVEFEFKKHQGRYNDIKLAIDSERNEKTNKSFGFINFRHALYLYAFIVEFEGKSWQ